MNLVNKAFFCLFLLFMSVSVCSAQFAGLKNKDVAQLSQDKINEISTQIKNKGLSIDDAMKLAKMKGATDKQINDLRQRLMSPVSNNSVNSSLKVNKPNTIGVNEALSPKKNKTIKKSRVFGSSFFNSQKLSFAPSINVPVSDTYIVGVGDNIQVNIYGASQQYYDLEVERNGCVRIPGIAPIKLAGLSMRSAKRKIKANLYSIYSGMRASKANTFLSLGLGQLKSMSVNIIGEVNTPGTYTIPAGASVFNALYLAGGPNDNGSFRRIDVLRNGKTISTIDVYDYLINGKTKANIQLREQDVILVHPYINRVATAGEFKRKALFETKEGETLSQLIEYAGGFTALASKANLKIYSSDTNSRNIKDVDIKNANSTIIMSGDSVIVGKIIDKYSNMVRIHGSVYRPGDYQLTEGMNLMQLIENADGLKEDAFMNRALISRKKSDNSLEMISFSLLDIINKSKDIILQAKDEVIISSKFDLKENSSIEVLGEVLFPGKFKFSDNMSMQDALLLAGSFKENASISSISVARRLNYDEQEKNQMNKLHVFNFDVARDLSINNAGSDFILMPFDKIYVREAIGYSAMESVSVQGQVNHSGEYAIQTKEETILDILSRAGGLSKYAYLPGAFLRRKIKLSDAEYLSKLEVTKQDTTLDIADVKQTYYTTVGIDFTKMSKNSTNNLIVKSGDIITIPSKMQTVSVFGSVYNPVAHAYNKKLNLKKYVRRSGGFTDRAKKKRVYVLYANGTTEATKTSFFIRTFPKVQPGCQIIVPKKPQIDKAAQSAKWLGVASVFTGLITAIAIAFKI